MNVTAKNVQIYQCKRKGTNILRLNSFQKYLKFCCEMLEFTIVHDSRTGITNKEKKISPTFVDFMIMIVLDI